MQKPFLKWVGGKTQIIEKVLSKFPKEIENYYELFLGGGSVLLALLSSDITIKGKIYAYDINKPLIYLYKNIQRNPSNLYKKIKENIEIYESCPYIDKKVNRKPETLEEAKESRETYYYWIRKQYNDLPDKLSILGSAYFIILNKLCFRGVYREGPNGFNVPFGHYKKTPTIITEENIHKISKLIQKVKFKSNVFIKTCRKAKKGDFVYMDPPYVPVDNKSFVTYNKRGFNEKDHKNVFNITKLYELKGVKFLLSNANVPYVQKQYTDEKITLEEIICKRAINSKNPGAKAKELLIYN
uniref:site-specific DNA-methyltransferase (adenine-specific) n=1 Tax=viral metagenome TaxID=1070528 RepID=A0A6C0F8L5_9ZZZZ